MGFNMLGGTAERRLQMGYATYFYGKLEFTRRLTRAEILWIERILSAGTGTSDPKVEANLEREVTAATAPGHAQIFSMPHITSRRAELQGFIAPKGEPGHIDYQISDDKRGLEYPDTEKSYSMIEGLNFIIANARLRIPDFGLKGEMCAYTEFKPYTWYIRIGEDGWAYQAPTTEDDFISFRRRHRKPGYNDDPEYGRSGPRSRRFVDLRSVLRLFR
jgi:hypothetical protein